MNDAVSTEPRQKLAIATTENPVYVPAGGNSSVTANSA